MKTVLITGARGYIGQELVKLLHEKKSYQIVSTDIRESSDFEIKNNIISLKADIRDESIDKIISEHKVDVVVHLASIVTPGKDSSRDFEYSVDVLGTKNILDSCIKNNVSQFIVTSSGAAYGYYADNPQWLDEQDEIRGNDEFSYSCHKKIVEQMLAEYRDKYPQLKQLIFRPGTVLGDNVKNQITSLFEKPVIMGISGSATPFVFIWDRDVVNCLLQGIERESQGIYNLAGDGCLTMKEIAKILGKPYVSIPEGVIRGALSVLHKFSLSQYGPEQVIFLKYRPVLSNKRLKNEFNYIPQKNSAETFAYYLEHKRSV